MERSLAGWVAMRLPLDADHRDELVGSLTRWLPGRRRRERACEAASLVGLGLQLWGRREGGDDARLAARQGIYLGGIVLALLASAGGWSVGHVAGALLMMAAAALASGGWRSPAMGLTVAGVVASGTTLALSGVALLAFVIGERFGSRHCWRGLLAGAVGSAAVAALAWSAPPGAVGAAVIATLMLLPIVSLAVGWFDPRFALSGAVVWLGATA